MIFVGIVFLVSCRSSVPRGDPKVPDIILISIDTLRADHLSCYGYERRTSPFIDTLAQKGIRFLDARSPSPWTLPTHTTMLTGLHPHSHGVVDDSMHRGDDVLMLAEAMKEQGYDTAGFVSSLYVSSIFGFEKGFDHFHDFGLHTEKKNLSGVVHASEVVDKALAWIQNRKEGTPIFVFLHFYDVHYPYEPPSPYDEIFDRPSSKGENRYKNYFYYQKNTPTSEEFTHIQAQYDESIRYVDTELARFAKEIEGRSLRWIITADHGEEFGERGAWGHAHTLYQEQLHIPLIISGEGFAPKEEARRVGTEDIMPTIFSLVGRDDFVGDGVNVLADDIPERIFIAETSRFRSCRLSLADTSHRLEWNLNTSTTELFKQSDPLEKKNIADGEAALVVMMKQKLLERIGFRWKANVAGNVVAPFIWDGIQIYKKKKTVKEGEHFTVFPFDVSVEFQTGKKTSIFSRVSHLNSQSELVYLGKDFVQSQHLDTNVEQMLQQLGYIQED